MKKIIFMFVPLLIVLLAFAPVNSFTVKGIVKDDKGLPVPFATVTEKGTRNTIKADANGVFTIAVKNINATLIISSVSFSTKEIKLNGKSNIDVVLIHLSNMTEIIVTTDAGIKKVTTEKDYSSQNVPPYKTETSVSNTLNGRAAGLTVYGYGNRSLWKSPGLAINKNISNAGWNGGYRRADTTLDKDFNTEDYDKIVDNPFLRSTDNPLSTFSIDVDAASYSNIRRFLNNGELPPAGAVRIEEMINYFHYDYPQPTGADPFSVNTEISDCPWNKDHKLVLIGMQGKIIPAQNLPASNLVFLIDVSGSMMDENKLPLVKQSMKLLVDQLRQDDKVAIVVYAGNAGLVLPSTNGSEKTKIKDAIDALEAGGSTAGGAGIKLAYKAASENFVKGGNNRVILCTDGDFNVGTSSDDELERLIEKERESHVFLTVLGYGMGNYKDNKMQKLADKGNGNHAYIDNLSEAKKVLVNEFGGTLFTIAKDVKLQVEFNPAKVQGYRLIGYENRMMAKEDFNDDRKDAGELGSGHTVTALYEIIPFGVQDSFLKKIDKLKYQEKLETVSNSPEIMNIKLRYKQPEGSVSKLIEHPVIDTQVGLNATSDNFRFAASVAEFGMLLRQSEYRANANFAGVLTLASNAKGSDTEGYRAEFLKLVTNARSLVKADKTLKNDFEKLALGKK